MRETLLFDSSQEMSSALDKIQAAFPTVRLLNVDRNESSGFPVGLDLGIIDEHTWCDWAIENGIFDCCNTLVLLSLDPPDWMKLMLEGHRLKEEAKRLEGI
jgi:hypothetical protein